MNPPTNFCRPPSGCSACERRSTMTCSSRLAAPRGSNVTASSCRAPCPCSSFHLRCCCYCWSENTPSRTTHSSAMSGKFRPGLETGARRMRLLQTARRTGRTLCDARPLILPHSRCLVVGRVFLLPVTLLGFHNWWPVFFFFFFYFQGLLSNRWW